MWRWRPPRIHANGKGPVDRFQVLGDRCSGTNFLAHLVEQNFAGLTQSTELGWKHGFIDRDQTAAPGLLVIVAHRHPLRWLSSVHRSPFELSDAMRRMSFAEFIRAEWAPVWRLREHGREIEKPATADMRPGTSIPFANVFEMRAAKLRYYEDLAAMPTHVAFIRFEDANRDPEGVVTALAEGFGLRASPRFYAVSRYRGGADAPYRPRIFAPISREDRVFIMENLDHAAEAAVGYDAGVIPKYDGLSLFDPRTRAGFLRYLRKGV